ncbi:hypothetical protein EV359DRAFT_78747 [Lentinula novae-zelandiae]|nr:hypothetical protein EV359DRAFT_78747 [Lentinula novae-zelandiae]
MPRCFRNCLTNPPVNLEEKSSLPPGHTPAPSAVRSHPLAPPAELQPSAPLPRIASIPLGSSISLNTLASSDSSPLSVAFICPICRLTPHPTLLSSSFLCKRFSFTPSSSTCSHSPFWSAPSSTISTLKQHPRLTLRLPRDFELSNRDELGLGIGAKSFCEYSALRKTLGHPLRFPCRCSSNGLTNQPANLEEKYPNVSPIIPRSNTTSIFICYRHSYAILLFHGTSNAIPMKGVVHKVLRRTRTSGGVLQTALIRFVQLAPVFLSAFHAAVSAATLLTTKPTMNTGCQPPSSPAAPAYVLCRSIYTPMPNGCSSRLRTLLNADIRADRTSSVG